MVMLEHQVKVMLDYQGNVWFPVNGNFWAAYNGLFNGWTPDKGIVWVFGKPNGCTPGGVNGWTLFLTLNKRENRRKNQLSNLTIFPKNLIFKS